MGTFCSKIDNDKYAANLAIVMDLRATAIKEGPGGEIQAIEVLKGGCDIDWIVRSKPFSLCIAKIKAGTEFKDSHQHIGQTETIHILEGGMGINIDGVDYYFRAGQVFTIAAGKEHKPTLYVGDGIQAARLEPGLIGGLNGHDGVI